MLKNFCDLLISRGFWNQSTDDDGIRKLLSNTTTGYIGFDCTANSLHVGSLLLVDAFKVISNSVVINL